jgi:hypothetical protein
MISIIPKDETIVIDGEGVSDQEKMRVSKMFGLDIHAIQFDPEKNIGEIEFVKTPFQGEELDRVNQRITSEDLNVEGVRSLHEAIVFEIEEDNERRGQEPEDE